MTRITRRAALASVAPLLAGAALVSTVNAQQPSASRALVACLSRSGNTRVVAQQVRRATGADYFEIVTADPYPEDYEETVAQAERERQADFRPRLRELVASMDAYDTVYLAFPIWGMTVPPPVRSFLATHDLAGKTVFPLITHGGYGIGSSLAVLAEDALAADIRNAFTLEQNQERQTLAAVTEWMAATRT